MKHRSNLARTLWIGRLRGFGCGAAAERAGGVLPWRGIAGVWRFWGFRARLAWSVAQGHEGDMCDSPETTKQWTGGLVGACHGGGGAELRGSPASGVVQLGCATPTLVGLKGRAS